MRIRRIVLVFVFVSVLGGFVADRGARAAGVLLRFSGDRDSAIARYRADGVEVTSRPLVDGDVRIESDVYLPRGDRRGVLVLVHGMHFHGHREERLVALARGFAAAGVEVVTPRIDSLASYRLDPQAIEDIGVVARVVSREHHVTAVPVFGISFAGGIALLAAADPQLGRSVSAVVTLGAHDDLGRVARWFAGDVALGPNGERVATSPHPYGAQLFLAEDPARFFGEENAPLVRELVSQCLHDDWRGARARAGGLTPRGRVVLEGAIAGRLDEATRSSLRAMIDERQPQLASLSPHGRVASIRVPVSVLHGTADPIVPATEAHHLARSIPTANVLVTDALRHAENADDASMGDRLALIRFVDDVLGYATEVP